MYFDFRRFSASVFNAVAVLATVSAFPVSTWGNEASPPYFPAGTWDSYIRDTEHQTWQVSFYENWFGGQLRAMGEPSLFGQSLTGSGLNLRMTEIPTFRGASSVRITRDDDQQAVATFTVLDGAGGYAPGHISLRLHTDVDEEAVLAIMGEFAAHKRRDRSVMPDSMCLDGTSFVFEFQQAARFAAFERHECALTTRERALIDMFKALFFARIEPLLPVDPAEDYFYLGAEEKSPGCPVVEGLFQLSCD